MAGQRLLELLDAKAGEVEREIRRPAGLCQEQTLLMTEQFSSMECDAFHGSYLSDTIPEAVFHGQVVRTIAYFEGLDRAASASLSSSTHANTTSASTITSRRPPVERREHRQRFWEAIVRGLSCEEARVVASMAAAVGTRWSRENGGHAVKQPSLAFGALSVVCRTRRDRDPTRSGLRDS